MGFIEFPRPLYNEKEGKAAQSFLEYAHRLSIREIELNLS